MMLQLRRLSDWLLGFVLLLTLLNMLDIRQLKSIVSSAVRDGARIRTERQQAEDRHTREVAEQLTLLRAMVEMNRLDAAVLKTRIDALADLHAKVHADMALKAKTRGDRR